MHDRREGTFAFLNQRRRASEQIAEHSSAGGVRTQTLRQVRELVLQAVAVQLHDPASFLAGLLKFPERSGPQPLPRTGQTKHKYEDQHPRAHRRSDGAHDGIQSVVNRIQKPKPLPALICLGVRSLETEHMATFPEIKEAEAFLGAVAALALHCCRKQVADRSKCAKRVHFRQFPVAFALLRQFIKQFPDDVPCSSGNLCYVDCITCRRLFLRRLDDISRRHALPISFGK